MRYVILKHTGHGETHWDLMLEVEGQEELRTIQLAKWPLSVGEDCVANELPPHRRAYLEYEGKISGDRGSVIRVEEGVYEIQSDRLLLRPSGIHRVILELKDGTAVREG